MRIPIYLILLVGCLFSNPAIASDSESAWAELVAEFTQYESLALPDPRDREAMQAGMDKKLALHKEVVRHLDNFMEDYPEGGWVSAALYYKALSYKAHAEAWVNSPMPYNKDDPAEAEYFAIYTERLEERAAPYAHTADALFQSAVEFATKNDLHNQWVDAARRERGETEK